MLSSRNISQMESRSLHCSSIAALPVVEDTLVATLTPCGYSSPYDARYRRSALQGGRPLWCRGDASTRSPVASCCCLSFAKNVKNVCNIHRVAPHLHEYLINNTVL